MKVFFAPMFESNPYQDNLSTELERSGVEVESLEPGPFLDVVREAVGQAETTVVHFHWLDTFYSSRWFVGRLFLAMLFVPQLLLLKLLNVPVVWTVHNLSSHEYDDHIEWFVRRFFIRHICDRMILHCEAAATGLIEMYDLPETARDRMSVIPHGHYIDNYPNEVDQTEAREALSLDDDATVFLFFGEIRPYKNVQTLIKTFDSTTSTDCELVVAGRPHSDDHLHEVRSAAATADRVTTQFNFIATDEVQHYMNAADAVVLPFKDVLTSGSAILAMSFARPFVAPAIGCLPEIAGENGAFLYSDDDGDGLEDALQAARHSNLGTMGKRSYERIQEFDWSTIATRTARLYASAS